jgi:hypothetical protein
MVIGYDGCAKNRTWARGRMYRDQEASEVIQRLEIMLNDVRASSLFKTGPLHWFNLQATVANIRKRGIASEKQMSLIKSVFDQYILLKKVSDRFTQESYTAKLTTLLTHFFNKLPSATDRSDRGRRGQLGVIRSAISNGETVHEGTFKELEKVTERMNPEAAIGFREEIANIRKRYLEILETYESK